MNANQRPALFLDRDGVLVKDKGYMSRPEELELLPGVEDFLVQAKSAQFYLIVVSNQSGVARGYFNLEDVQRCHMHLDQIFFERLGFKLDRYYVCPHHPSGIVPEYSKVCQCRKPEAGLIKQAMRDFDIALRASFMIGDKISDVDCGARLGISTIQIDGGQYPLHPSIGHVVCHLAEAMDWIKAQA